MTFLFGKVKTGPARVIRPKGEIIENGRMIRPTMGNRMSNNHGNRSGLGNWGEDGGWDKTSVDEMLVDAGMKGDTGRWSRAICIR